MNQTPKITNSSNYFCLKHLIRPARLKPLEFYNKCSPAKVQIG